MAFQQYEHFSLPLFPFRMCILSYLLFLTSYRPLSLCMLAHVRMSGRISYTYVSLSIFAPQVSLSGGERLSAGWRCLTGCWTNKQQNKVGSSARSSLFLARTHTLQSFEKRRRRRRRQSAILTCRKETSVRQLGHVTKWEGYILNKHVQ